MLIMEYAMLNESNLTTISPSTYSLQYNASLHSNLSTLAEIIAECNKTGVSFMRVPIQVVVLVLAFLGNTSLLWVLVKNRKTLSPSEVLGLNFAVLGVIYCLSLPLDIGITATKNRVGLLLRISNVIATLSFFGCPLLLTSMCLERYVAVAHPVLFMRLGKWEYRAACSATIWFLNCIIGALMFVYTIAFMGLVLSLIVNLLFFVMGGSLLGIILVLLKKGPGEGDQNSSVVKKRALKNVVAILLPSAITYFPILALAPFLLLVQVLTAEGINDLFCSFLSMFSIIPNFGVCIGPMFYIVRLKQTFCHKNNKSEDIRETTVVQRT